MSTAATDDTTGKGLLVKADGVADTFREEVKKSLAAFSRPPKLVGILSTSSAPSRSYAQFTKKQCEELGVEFILKTVGAAESTEFGEGEGVEEAIIEANEDDSVDGIMVYYPIFGVQQDHYLQQVVSPIKDVEGLNVKFHYNLYHNIRFIEPASLLSAVTQQSASTIVKCLEYVGVYNRILKYGDRAYGKTITVINRSEVVGRPLAALLANDGARVFSVDIDSIQEYTKRPSTETSPSDSSANANSRRRYHPHHVVHPSTKSLQECLSISDVVISAVPSASYKVPTGWLKDGCVCVNVASEKNFEKDVREKASIYVPAVGKVTILMLLRNLLRLRHYNELLRESQK
ncbi:methylenetetrahydrofolate dehydrogenase (NAD+) [Pyrrhoderma noxium]|uniref:Methylenetetrahydrofolate dehydrogenase (NAD+) n=1 Tax=Pyrrhoderma noxium TaxID=2282107 RepID=A0A286UNR9_9AGAM|nr:methylenetetrahydrofolate dehydrogenase (NAD+) [Pyrrhoderma noxium]